jgi:hypothetical protein
MPLDCSAGVATPGRTREISDWNRLLLAAAVAIGCALGVWINHSMIWGAGQAGMDFNQFYSASRLAGTGHLYDWDALRAVEAENGLPVRSGRLPVVSYGVKAIGWMPFPWALGLWRAASVAALLAVCAIWPGGSRTGFVAAMAWSMPVVYLISLGQDVAFWVLFFAIGIALLARGYPRLAGVAFALCLCKYHLCLGIPVMLAAQKRWSTLAAGGLTIAALIAASFAIEGAGWPRAYLQTLGAADFSPGIRSMPNLRGLASWSPAGAGFVEAAAAIAVVALLWMVCRNGASIGLAGALAAACGLILGHHGYLQDTTLLIPLAVLTVQSKEAVYWLRVWGVVVLTPVLMLVLTGAKPYVGQVLLVGFIAAAGVAAWRGTGERYAEVQA